MTLEQLRTQALRYVAGGDYARALLLLRWVVRQFPTALDDRMRVADILLQCDADAAARRVYAAVAWLDIQGGRPLHALVAIQALADLGEEVGPLRAALASIYCAGSQRVGRVGGRLAPPLPDQPVEPSGLVDVASLAEAVTAAADAAADLAVGPLPAQFPALPLLSELTEATLARVLESAVIRRLPHGAAVLRQGDPAQEFYFVASGSVRVFVTAPDGAEEERARLHEGALFGEMALVGRRPRAATVEVVGAADLVELGRASFRAAADELGTLAAALERFTRDRLLKNLLATSPIFAPFDPEQRRDLARHFSLRELDSGEEAVTEGRFGDGLSLVLSGEVEVVKAQATAPEIRVATLGPGECFGVISLLRHQPATATVRATEPTVLLTLAPQYFTRLVGAVPELGRYFEELSEANLRATEAALDAAQAAPPAGNEPLL